MVWHIRGMMFLDFLRWSWIGPAAGLAAQDSRAANLECGSLVLVYIEAHPQPVTLAWREAVVGPFCFLLSCGCAVFVVCGDGLAFSVLGKHNTVSKQGVLPDGVSCWRLCWKCPWTDWTYLAITSFEKTSCGRENASGRKETVWKELPWDTSVTGDFWLFHVRCIQVLSDDAKLQQSSLLSK